MRKLLFSAVLLSAATTAFAVDYTWTGEAGNSKWKDAGNWSGGDAYPQSYVDTAAFPPNTVVTLADSPAQSGTVSLGAGTVLTIANESTVDWKGLSGPGTLIKNGSGSLNVRNDVSGWCIYGNAVIEVCAGKVLITTSGSEPARAPDYTGTDPTLGDCTFRMKGGAVEQYGWPTLYGTVTVECYTGIEANFLGATLRGCAGSKLVKTGDGTLNVLCKFTNGDTKCDLEIAAGEVAFRNGCDFSGTLSGTGAVSSSPELRLRGDNTDFSGTIVLRNENDAVRLSHKNAALNAAFDFVGATTAVVPDAYDVEFHRPFAVPEGKTVNLQQDSYWMWIFGMSGPGKVVKTGAAGLVLLNRIEDRTGAVDGNLQLDIDEGGLQFYSSCSYSGTSAGDAVFGDATLTYHTAVTGVNNGWTRINGTLTVVTDYDVQLTSYGAIRGTGSIVKEGTGALTIGGGLGDGNDAFDADIAVRDGKVVVTRTNGTGNILGRIEGPGAFELVSGSDYTDRISGAITAPFTCRGGNLEIKPGAEFDDLTLVDGARVKILTLVDPLRVHGALTASGETKSVIDAMSRSGSTGSLALVLADGEFAADAFDYALPDGWAVLSYPTRVYARTAGASNFWTGGAGSASWGDAANWADGVPSGSVVLYADDVSVIDVPAGTTFGDTAYLRGTGDVAFSGAGLGSLTFSVDALKGKVVKRGTATCLSPKIIGALDEFVVEAGVVRRAAQKLAANIVVRDGAQFDVNGVKDPSPMPTYVIAGDGPDESGALVNAGDPISHDTSQMKGLVLTDDATIGGTANWGFVNSGYAETTLDLGGHLLTKIGDCDFWMTNVKALGEGTFAFTRGHIRFGDKPSDLTPVTLTLGDGAGFEQRVALTIGAISFGANVKTDYGVYGWLNIADRLATSAPLTLYYLNFPDGATFAPNGVLTIATQVEFGSDLTLDLSAWAPAAGRTLLKAKDVTLETFGSVVGMPENYKLAADAGRLYLKSTAGLILLFR